MKKLTVSQKAEALTNALKNLRFSAKYSIVTADKRCGHKFAIAVSNVAGGINVKTGYMSYEEMNAFILGYYRRSIGAL